MAEKRGDFDLISYILGIASIVMAFFLPLAGLAFGITGLFHAKKQKTSLSNKAKKLNLVGVILSGILFVILIVLQAYFAELGLSNFLTGS